MLWIRILIIILSALGAVPAIAAAPVIETGRQLATSCAAYLKKSKQETENILSRRDACREYLIGFVEAYGAGQSAAAKMETEGQVGEGPDRMPCFALPDYLSFSDFARLVVEFANMHPDYAAKPAFLTTAASLANKYPCRKAGP